MLTTGGFGVTIFDSLDTMLIMGLDDIYQKSLEHVLNVQFEKVSLLLSLPTITI